MTKEPMNDQTATRPLSEPDKVRTKRALINRRRTTLNLGPVALEDIAQLRALYGAIMGREVSISLAVRRALQAHRQRVETIRGNEQLEALEVFGLMRSR